MSITVKEFLACLEAFEALDISFVEGLHEVPQGEGSFLTGKLPQRKGRPGRVWVEKTPEGFWLTGLRLCDCNRTYYSDAPVSALDVALGNLLVQCI